MPRTQPEYKPNKIVPLVGVPIRGFQESNPKQSIENEFSSTLEERKNELESILLFMSFSLLCKVHNEALHFFKTDIL